jgi:cytochrome c biogenesis protein CcmG, thiol:disulfide interchange protein DsbE
MSLDPERRALCLRLPLAALPLSLSLGVFTSQAQAVAIGDAAPALALEGLAGPVNLAALRGRVVLLDFWASWCPPCRQSFPWMDQMLARHGAAGLSVVAVNLDRQRAAAEQFLRAVPSRASIAFDPAGDTPRRFGAKAMPSSFIVGRDGRIRVQHDGFREADQAPLEAALRQALAA